LVVVGGEGLWNVHVHVDDVGAAVEAGVAAGRPHRIRVTHFVEQIAARAAPSAAGEATGRAVVVLAFGDGLAALFRDAGGHVVEVTTTTRPSTGELLAAVRGTGAREVVLVPNDRDVIPTAEAAATIAESEDGLRVAVIPTHTQVQGLAALAVSDPGRPFEQDLVEMAVAARHTRSGAVTVAARRAITTAGPCEPGDVLGAVEGDFTVVGSDLYDVSVEVINRLLGGGGELFTVLTGSEGEDLAQRCVAYLRETFPAVDVLVYDGGQDRYPLLFGVE
jgi:dihydroxyacetone kinase-like predicted kinase